MSACLGIEVDRLTKRFGAIEVLSDLSLSVSPGEAVALIGENGSGKTTLLRILAGVLLPDAGHAVVGGHDVVRDERKARAATGYLSSRENSWQQRLTGRENLEFFAALSGYRRRPARDRARELLGAVGLAADGDRDVRAYSSGMRQRLSLARVLLSRPAVLLLDEPERSLDEAGRSMLREYVAAHLAADGAALIATHATDVTTDWCDRPFALPRSASLATQDS
jgi:heme ABC exporter ATP-binding subunit CcmA